MEAEAHFHLHRQAAVLVDQDTLFDVVVHDGRSGVGVGARREAVAIGLLRGQGEACGARGGVRAGVDDALLGLKAKVD